jgi:hypothetical protein
VGQEEKGPGEASEGVWCCTLEEWDRPAGAKRQNYHKFS